MSDEPKVNEQEPVEGEEQSLDDMILQALETPSPKVQEVLNKRISEEVKRILAATPPKRGATQNKLLTKDDFKKMTYAQRNALFNENRALYDTLK